MMDRRFSLEENEAIIEKAIKYRKRGVVGIDLAGPIKRTKNSHAFRPKDIKQIVKKARDYGLGVTVHTGEATNVEEMWEVIRELKPERIGHGIACITDKKLMKYLKDHKIVLETCPTSNMNTKLIKDFDEMRMVYRTLIENDILFTINTDGPEMQLISLRKEYEKLLDNAILSKEELLKANEIAHKASFIQ